VYSCAAFMNERIGALGEWAELDLHPVTRVGLLKTTKRPTFISLGAVQKVHPRHSPRVIQFVTGRRGWYGGAYIMSRFLVSK